jgi:hypothetical protein
LSLESDDDMASEIQLAHSETGVTLYALVRNSVGQVWSTVGSSFGAYATANLADYDIALTEQGTASRFYAGNFPAATAGSYSVTVYKRAGGAPAEGDLVVGTGTVEWNGTAVISNVNIRQVNSIAVDGAGTSGDPWGPV